jgi:hypothetical protein
MPASQGHPTLYEFSRQPRHTISLKVRPPILNREVLTFNEVHFGQALAKCISQKIEFTRRRAIEESDDRLRLLRSRRKRPRGPRAAEQGDELAPSYGEHGTCSPLRAGGANSDHRPANDPCSRFSAPSAYH